MVGNLLLFTSGCPGWPSSGFPCRLVRQPCEHDAPAHPDGPVSRPGSVLRGTVRPRPVGLLQHRRGGLTRARALEFRRFRAPPRLIPGAVRAGRGWSSGDASPTMTRCFRGISGSRHRSESRSGTTQGPLPCADARRGVGAWGLRVQPSWSSPRLDIDHRGSVRGGRPRPARAVSGRAGRRRHGRHDQGSPSAAGPDGFDRTPRMVQRTDQPDQLRFASGRPCVRG